MRGAHGLGPRMLRTKTSALELIRTHARSARPDECCGALVGHTDGVVVRAAPLPNESRQPASRYEIGPGWVRRAEAEAAAEGMAVIGFYHSHPDRSASPSLLDIECAWPWYVYVIDGSDGARAWKLREDRVGFDEVEIVAEDDDGAEAGRGRCADAGPA